MTRSGVGVVCFNWIRTAIAKRTGAKAALVAATNAMDHRNNEIVQRLRTAESQLARTW